MEKYTIINSKYYLTEVDIFPDSVYCYHNPIAEQYILEHKHQKAQFLYIEGGVVYIKMQNDTFYLPARHYMWIPPNAIHSIHPSSPDIIMTNVYFPINEGDDSFYDRTGIYPTNEFILQYLLFTHQWHGNVQPSDKSDYTIITALKEILPKVSSQALSLSLPYPQDNRLRAITEYMENKMDTSVTLSKLALHFSISERSLSRLFRKDVQMSFVQYHTILRMLKALHLLITNKYSVGEVATLTGYNSLPTFSNTFHKVIGIRPTEYMNTKNMIINNK